MRNKYIVYYCYLTNKYEQLIDKQFQRLVDSGLYDEVTKIYVNICGDEELIKKQLEYFNKYDKVEIYSTNSTDNTYEYQGLKCVYDIAQKLEGEDRILYLHTKGSSRNCSLDMELWRNCMEHELVDKWRNAMNYCTVDRAVGINLKYSPRLHFSGNMWWSTARHIQMLVEPKQSISDEEYYRHYYEFWITKFKADFKADKVMFELNRYEVNYHVYKEFPFLDKKYFMT